MEFILCHSQPAEDILGLQNMSYDECIEEIDRSLKDIKINPLEELELMNKGANQQRKKKFKLENLTPTNIQQQRQLFIASGFTYNPQFTYNQPVYKDYGLDHSLLSQALLILKAGKKSYRHQNSAEPYLSEEETLKRFTSYCCSLGLENKVEIELEQHSVSRTRVKFTNKRTIIVIRKPVEYTESTIEGVLNHEIGTHILRKRNNDLQDFKGRRELYGLGKEKKQIEEGLAVICQHINEKWPLLYIAALRYYSCILASQETFSGLFHKLREYLPDEQECWRQCIRVKRGIQNTEELRGFYKDQQYFKGAHQLLSRRRDIDFEKMFWGKLNIEDLTKVNLVKGQSPPFMDEKFYDKLDYMAKINYIY